MGGTWAVLAEPVVGAGQVKVRPHETLFRMGDSSEAGIFIVVEGRLGVFLQVGLPAPPAQPAPACCSASSTSVMHS